MENKLHPRFEVHVFSVQSPGLPQLLVLPLWPLAREPHFLNHFCKVATLGSELGLEAVGVYRGGPLTHVEEAPRQGPGPTLSLLLRSQTEALSPPPSPHPWSRPLPLASCGDPPTSSHLLPRQALFLLGLQLPGHWCNTSPPPQHQHEGLSRLTCDITSQKSLVPVTLSPCMRWSHGLTLRPRVQSLWGLEAAVK